MIPVSGRIEVFLFFLLLVRSAHSYMICSEDINTQIRGCSRLYYNPLVRKYSVVYDVCHFFSYKKGAANG